MISLVLVILLLVGVALFASHPKHPKAVAKTPAKTQPTLSTYDQVFQTCKNEIGHLVDAHIQDQLNQTDTLGQLRLYYGINDPGVTLFINEVLPAMDNEFPNGIQAELTAAKTQTQTSCQNFVAGTNPTTPAPAQVVPTSPPSQPSTAPNAAQFGNAWIVVFASVRETEDGSAQQEASQIAQRISVKGGFGEATGTVQVLSSDGVKGLTPGYLVVFTSLATSAAAKSQLASLRTRSGIPGAYVRCVGLACSN